MSICWIFRKSMSLGLVVCIGCDRGPSAPALPEIDPLVSAEAAIHDYDQNGDGLLSRVELAACPALAVALARLDGNRDEQLSVEEIEVRIDEWLASGTSLVEVIAEVTLNGKALAGANISIEPEPFLGPGYTSVVGTTDTVGIATFRGHDARLPGVHLGFYRVRISHLGPDGREVVPAEYNQKSELGIEIAGDKSNLTRFDLKSI
jgi:hypothetical protein